VRTDVHGDYKGIQVVITVKTMAYCVFCFTERNYINTTTAGNSQSIYQLLNKAFRDSLV
jgi:hypothetical protein